MITVCNAYSSSFVCRRSSLPESKNPNYYNLQMNITKSATMGNPCENQHGDNEYINVEMPIVHGEEDNYVIMAAQESANDSYASIKPISQSAAKYSHETPTNYVNLEFTGSSSEHASDGSPLSKQLSSPIHNGVKVSHEITPKAQDEADRKVSTTVPCNYGNNTSLFPAKEADGEYENLVPTKPPSTAATTTDKSLEYVMMSNTKGYKECVTIKPPTVVTPLQPATVSVSQHGSAGGYKDFVPLITSMPGGKLLPSEATATESAVACKEFAPIKTVSSTADISLSSANRSAVGYEDFVPTKTPGGGSVSSEISTINDNQAPRTDPALPYKEFISIKAHLSAQTSPPLQMANEAANRYEDFIPVETSSSTHTSNSESHSTIENHEDSEEYSRLQFRSKEDPTISQPHSDSATSYSMLGRSNSDGFYSKLEVSKTGQDKPQVPSRNLKKPIKLYKVSSDVVSENHEDSEEYSRLQFRIKEDPAIPQHDDSATSYSTLGRSNSEAFTVKNHEDMEEYSRLQFRSEEDRTISRQNDSAASYSMLGRSNSDGFYSKLEVLKTGQNKPQVPSRNLKKPIKLYEASSNIVSVAPPLPPRNRTLQESVGSSTPPLAGPKPVVLPKSVTSSVTPPIGPKPGTRNSEELKYCELEFVGIGQPRFRPHSKQFDDQALPSQHDTYAIVDRDASIGLQLALEQKKHYRR